MGCEGDANIRVWNPDKKKVERVDIADIRSGEKIDDLQEEDTQTAVRRRGNVTLEEILDDNSDYESDYSDEQGSPEIEENPGKDADPEIAQALATEKTASLEYDLLQQTPETSGRNAEHSNIEERNELYSLDDDEIVTLKFFVFAQEPGEKCSKCLIQGRRCDRTPPFNTKCLNCAKYGGKCVAPTPEQLDQTKPQVQTIPKEPDVKCQACLES